MPQPNKSMMREYLLGTLSTERASELDVQCLTDQQVRLDFWEVEALLIRDYVQDRLSTSDRSAFQKQYLSTLRNQEHVALVAGLLSAQKVRSGMRFAPPVRNTWLLAALLLLTVAGSLVFIRSVRRDTTELVSRVTSQRFLAESRIREIQSKLVAGEFNRQAIFTLGPVDRDGRREIAQIAVRPGTTEVTLVIPLTSPATSSRYATLYREEADRRTAIGEVDIYIPAHSRSALVYLATTSLKPDHYQVQIDRQPSVSFEISKN